MNVVCIKAHSQGILTVGKTYEVSGMETCGCGEVSYDIGIISPPGHRLNCDCGYRFFSEIWWVWAGLFAPLEEKGEMFIEEFLVNEMEYL